MNIQKLKISDLKPAPYNPRKSTKEQEQKLKESLQKFGIVEPVIFNQNTGYIVGGHFRVRELKKLGYTEIDCVIVNLSEEDEKELNIRLNANTGEWDMEVLKNWDANELEDWGLNIPVFLNEPNYEDLIGEEKNKPPTMKITFESPEQLQKAEIDIQELIDRKYNGAYFSVSAGEI